LLLDFHNDNSSLVRKIELLHNLDGIISNPYLKKVTSIIN